MKTQITVALVGLHHDALTRVAYSLSQYIGTALTYEQWKQGLSHHDVTYVMIDHSICTQVINKLLRTKQFTKVIWVDDDVLDLSARLGVQSKVKTRLQTYQAISDMRIICTMDERDLDIATKRITQSLCAYKDYIQQSEVNEKTAS